MNVKLNPKDKRELEALARVTGKDPGLLLRELLHEAILHRKQNGFHKATGDESFLAAAARLRAVGCVKGGPTDVATNPKHIEGFGGS